MAWKVIRTDRFSEEFKKFGEHGIKFISRSKKGGSIICIGEDVGHAIIIKTIERGN